jgi:hypothetical protein
MSRTLVQRNSNKEVEAHPKAQLYRNPSRLRMFFCFPVPCLCCNGPRYSSTIPLFPGCHMKSLAMLSAVLVILSGCYTYAPPAGLAPDNPARPVVGFVNYDEDGPTFETFGPSGPAQPIRVFTYTVIKIAPGEGAEGRPRHLEMLVGNRKAIDVDCSPGSPCQYRGIADTLVIDLRQVGGIQHNELITLSLTSAGGERAAAYLRSYRSMSFTGIRSPVLMRASGTAAGFRLENFAPSLAGGLQRNFASRDFSYLSGNALLTVYTLPESEYALSVGGVIDLGGFLQVGPTYHTRDKQWNLVIGTRPEFLFGLIPTLRPQ